MPDSIARRPGKRRLPTKMQAIAVVELLQGATMAAAMREAGYKPSTYHKASAGTALTIRELALQELTDHDITPAAVAERLRAKLYGLTMKNVKIYVPADAELGTTGHSEEESVIVEDHNCQLEAIRLLIRIMGLEAPTHMKHTGTVGVSMADRRKEQTAMWEKLATRMSGHS